MPPLSSLDGKSNELMVTPSRKPFMPFNVTLFVFKEIPSTSMPT